MGYSNLIKRMQGLDESFQFNKRDVWVIAAISSREGILYGIVSKNYKK